MILSGCEATKSDTLVTMSAMLTHSQLRRLVTARRVSFAVGVRGVIAEFHWAGNDTVGHDDGGLEIATARGALAIRMRGSERLAVLTPEDGHEHGPGADDHAGEVQVCWLPRADALLHGPTGITDLGNDDRAVRPSEREHRLFDLGLGLGHVRACVRTGIDSLVATLRRHAGEDILENGHPAMAAIKEHGPHRVFESASARIEVFQPIPSRARRERTPDGPHTHVLPRLIGSADPMLDQLPDGALPVLTVYPAH